MANLTLELNINSASNLLNVNLITKMHVYASITIQGENIRKKQKAKTTIDRSGGSNPSWNQAVKFSVNERLARDGRLTLIMRLVSRRVLGNKDIGGVNIPLLDLLNSITPSINGDGNDNSQEMNSMTYQVRTLSGKVSGFLTFSYRFKPDWPTIVNWNSVDMPPTPPPSPIGHPPLAPPEFPIEFPNLPEPPYHSKHPFASGSSDDFRPIPYDIVALEQAGHNHMPPLPRHEGYELYGFASPSPSPMGYGYESPSYQQPTGLGLGTGLLGGLMMEDIVSDAANCFDLYL